MDGIKCVLILIIISSLIEAWRNTREERKNTNIRRGIHSHSKRHMLLADTETKRRSTTQRTREIRKKPSGHLTPLEEDDMDNEEVVSVAIGPPPIRPKYDKVHWKHPPKPADSNISNFTATNMVKDVLTELGRELLLRQVSEEFIFGQFVGNSMRNLTSELRLKMQHEILELIVKYQKMNRGDVIKSDEKNTNLLLKDLKLDKKVLSINDTDDMWPDFSNLAKIVG